MLGVVYAVAIQAGSGDIWSPYYRITTYPLADGTQQINVNGIPHQALHPVDAPKESFYGQVYEWFPDRTYDDVLIVGDGGRVGSNRDVLTHDE